MTKSIGGLAAMVALFIGGPVLSTFAQSCPDDIKIIGSGQQTKSNVDLQSSNCPYPLYIYINGCLSERNTCSSSQLHYKSICGASIGNPPFSIDFGTGIGTCSYNASGDLVALPAEMAKFSADQFGNQILVSWTTESEQNVDRFELERGRDTGNGLEWINLSWMPAQGNSSTSISYSIADKNPLAGDNYYRLKVIDLDGAVNYSQIVAIQSIKDGFGDKVQIFPNPAFDQIQLVYDVSIQNAASPSVYLYDARGKMIIQTELERNNQILKLDDLNAGMYWVEVQYGNKRSRKSFIKLVD